MVLNQKTVRPTLILFPNSPLWNIRICKWTYWQIEKFHEMRTGIKRETKKRGVIRISDGKEYATKQECATDNGISDVSIYYHCIGKIKEPKYKYA